MILSLTFLLVLGSVFAVSKRRWRRSAMADTAKALELQQPDCLGERRRPKYKVTMLQSGLDLDPEN